MKCTEEKILGGTCCLQPVSTIVVSLRPNKTYKFTAWLFTSLVKILVRIWIVNVFLPPASANTSHQLGTKVQSNMCSIHLKSFLLELTRKSPGNLQDSIQHESSYTFSMNLAVSNIRTCMLLASLLSCVFSCFRSRSHGRSKSGSPAKR